MGADVAGAVALDSASLQRALLAWYATHGRKDLPWRNLPRDGSHAYEIYVSEIMLQQTQLSRVLESYYFPFLTRFPTLSVLADSSEQEVLHAWQGLGYYSRARYMHHTARICQERHAGMLPASLKSLRALPGIGDYTAGAIWCFGFGGRTHFADSNIARVLRRLVAQDLSAKPLLTLAQRLYSKNACFDYHQALIDLGALICTRSPKCHACPLQSLCKSAHLLAESMKPNSLTKPIKPRIPLTLHLALITGDLDFGVLDFALESSSPSSIKSSPTPCPKSPTTIALCRSNENLYKGLYNLPIIAKSLESTAPLPLESSLLDSPATHSAGSARLLGSFSHAYTKYTITAHVYALDSAYSRALIADSGAEFFALDTLPPISNLAKKALAYVKSARVSAKSTPKSRKI